MEDQAGGDVDYDDDDLDALPDNTFRNLQEDAIRSTQQPQSQLPKSKSPRKLATTTLAGGFENLTVGGDVAYHAPLHNPQQPSSDYGEFDDEMLDGEIFDAAEQPDLAAKYDGGHFLNEPREGTQREQWRQQRYGQQSQSRVFQGQRSVTRNQGPNHASVHNNIHGTSRNSPNERLSFQPEVQKPIAQPLQEPADVAVLQSQVQKLLSERQQLQQAIQNANDIAYAKSGEIAIVRANASKTEKEYEGRTRVLQKLHADEAARQRIEVEKARAELQKIATEKDFLENDLAEGTKQIRTLQRAIKKGNDKGTGKENIVVTPKKGKAVPYGDGFDNDEIQPLSPSKLALRSKAGTPKAAGKRKRKAIDDSPLRPLELARPVQAESSEEPVRNEKPASREVNMRPVRHEDQKFQFTQRLLNHRIRYDEERTLEALAKFKLPPQPQKALSTMLLDKLSPLEIPPDTENLPAAVALIVISLWSQCIAEKYHEPVHLLIDLVKYILLTNPLKTAPDLTNDLMSVLQETADILIIPRCQKLPPRSDRFLISSFSCLEIMLTMASDLSISPEEITRFWRTVRFDFIMMLLSFIHPLSELELTIAILHTSVLESSFAMIVPPGDGKQDTSEARVIDNLSRLLVESPRPSAGEPPLDAVELSELRLEILDLMEAMCATTYSATALAKHRLVIGRLVRVMNDELDHAYDYQYGHHQRIALVNAATRLLFYLTDNYAHLINMQARLSVIPGGEKKFLIVLTRLAFSEGGFLEKGIEDDVVDCAHQMLEARVSPEEAEGLVEAFSTAPGTSASTRTASESRGKGPA